MCHPEVPAGTLLPNVEARRVTVRTSGEDMPALLALPPGLPAAAMLVVNDIYGLTPFYEHLTRRLAQAGFVAVDPDFFFRQPSLGSTPTREQAQARRRKLDELQLVADLGATIDRLRAMPEVAGHEIGAIGFCLGGTCAMTLAAMRPDLAAAVSYYGFPVASTPGPLPEPLELVPQMTVPLLAHCGELDEGVGLDAMKRFMAAVERHGVDATTHLYPGLGHGFLARFLDEEESPEHHDACVSWGRTLDFLRAKLG